MRNRLSSAMGAAAILAFAGFGAPVSAESAMQPLKVSKECSQYSGDVPSFCTLTESSLDALPAGTKVLYYGPVANDPNFSSNNVVLDDGAGNTAAGNCIVYFGGGPTGMCAFYAGSGKLAGFQAIVKVTVDDKQIWHWDGGYLLAPATTN
jgi:hypothetical protein